MNGNLSVSNLASLGSVTPALSVEGLPGPAVPAVVRHVVELPNMGRILRMLQDLDTRLASVEAVQLSLAVKSGEHYEVLLGAAQELKSSLTDIELCLFHKGFVQGVIDRSIEWLSTLWARLR